MGNKWPVEIQNPKQRYSIIDFESLISFFNFTDLIEFQKQHNEWVIESIPKIISVRESMWSESIAVGSKPFVDKILINLKQDNEHKKLGSDPIFSLLLLELRSEISFIPGLEAPFWV